MTLAQLEHFRSQILAQQIGKHGQTPQPGQELFFHLGAIELQVGLNLVNQLITMEQAQLAIPPGAISPTM